jgi:hypothetical protein
MAGQRRRAHRLRGTLAVQLLLEGVPMDRVSILLGHSSVKIAERNCAPWVLVRQVQLDADLERVWKKDPLVQAYMLNGDMAIVDTPVLQMPVTSQRHENRELPN